MMVNATSESIEMQTREAPKSGASDQGAFKPRGVETPKLSLPPASSGRTEVRVQIDRLALDGFRLLPGEEQLVRTSMQAELGRLLDEEMLPNRLRSGGAMPLLPGGALRIASWKDPADLGRQIARALYGGLSHE
jgi:hypothetical protein